MGMEIGIEEADSGKKPNIPSSDAALQTVEEKIKSTENEITQNTIEGLNNLNTEIISQSNPINYVTNEISDIQNYLSNAEVIETPELPSSYTQPEANNYVYENYGNANYFESPQQTAEFGGANYSNTYLEEYVENSTPYLIDSTQNVVQENPIEYSDINAFNYLPAQDQIGNEQITYDQTQLTSILSTPEYTQEQKPAELVETPKKPEESKPQGSFLERTSQKIKSLLEIFNKTPVEHTETLVDNYIDKKKVEGQNIVSNSIAKTTVASNVMGESLANNKIIQVPSTGDEKVGETIIKNEAKDTLYSKLFKTCLGN